MNDPKPLARRAGLLYVLQGLPTPFAYIFVPNLLLATPDAAATAQRVLANEGLLRAAIVVELFGATLLLFTLMAFHRLFRGVDEARAKLLAAMMLASVPVSYVNALLNIAPIVLLKNPSLVAGLGEGAAASLATLFLRLHNYGLVVNQILWGLWLFPMGMLFLESGYFPRALAYPLFAAGAGYVLYSLGILVLPPELRWLTQWMMVLGAGELVFFWVAIVGTNASSPRSTPRPDPTGTRG